MVRARKNKKEEIAVSNDITAQSLVDFMLSFNCLTLSTVM